jgi:hypothetical protein
MPKLWIKHSVLPIIALEEASNLRLLTIALQEDMGIIDVLSCKVILEKILILKNNLIIINMQ